MKQKHALPAKNSASTHATSYHFSVTDLYQGSSGISEEQLNDLEKEIAQQLCLPTLLILKHLEIGHMMMIQTVAQKKMRTFIQKQSVSSVNQHHLIFLIMQWSLICYNARTNIKAAILRRHMTAFAQYPKLNYCPKSGCCIEQIGSQHQVPTKYQE